MKEKEITSAKLLAYAWTPYMVTSSMINYKVESMNKSEKQQYIKLPKASGAMIPKLVLGTLREPLDLSENYVNISKQS